MDAKLELRNIFSKAIKILSEQYKGSSLTDIFVLIDEESGELSVYDDEENCLVKEFVENWDRHSAEKEINYVGLLRTVVQEMDSENLFSSLEVYTPFSINLADEDFIVQEELLLIEDDSIIRLENDFMKRIDKEFDEFLDNLLKE
ncbi:hypothetical protein [Viscerimonas tarda]